MTTGKKPPPRVLNNLQVHQFVAEMILASGNIADAARAVGWEPDKAYDLLRKYPDLREIVREAIGRFAESQLAEWKEMHTKARATIYKSMDSEEPRVRLAAAEYVVERIEGKTPVVVRDDTPRVSMEAVEMRFVSALYLLKGWAVSEALAYAKAHPDEVEAWGKARGLIGDGGDGEDS